MKKLLILLLPIIIYCCKKEDSVNNMVVLLSDTSSFPAFSNGFSYAESRVIEYPNEGQIIPDFKLNVVTFSSREEETYEASFESLVNKPTFIFIDSLETPQEADQLFNEYIPASFNFEQIRTQPFIDVNQVWLVKSIENDYYMIQLLELTFVPNPKYNIEKFQHPQICTVKFKWKPI